MYDLVCVGNFTKDTIASSSGTRVVPGGAFNYGAHAARALGLRTAAVTRLAREDASVVRELERIGVDVRVTYTEKSTSLHLEYPSENPDDRVFTVTADAGPFTPLEVAGIETRAVVLGPSFHGEIGLDVIRALAQPGTLLAIDVQGYIRRVADGRLSYSNWEERREVLPLVTILKTDAVESQFLTGESDIYAAARILQSEGPQEVLLTHRDGVLVFDGKRFFEAPFLPATLVGRSGRGDTCLASYVSRRLVDPPGEAILWAAALTSKKLEAEGPYKGDYAIVERFVAERYRKI
ncbi:MAG: PfkB family carbohydrate kinase [Spirochaetia bacterium]|jgi:sugar/nucleoside kinase (ribokinase family)